MKHNQEYNSFDMLGFAQELAELSRYKSAYYAMEEERNYWKEKYQNMLTVSLEHNEDIIGGLLQVAMRCDVKKKEL